VSQKLTDFHSDERQTQVSLLAVAERFLSPSCQSETYHGLLSAPTFPFLAVFGWFAASAFPSFESILPSQRKPSIQAARLEIHIARIKLLDRSNRVVEQ
jgi:hypothetical protein